MFGTYYWFVTLFLMYLGRGLALRIKSDCYTVRKVLPNSLFVTDDSIAKLYVTLSLVKEREMVENFVTLL